MRRVIFNQKGGVGKSSITCNLAAVSADSGLRTLVVDLDPQGNSTRYLLGRPSAEVRENVADLFEQALSFNIFTRRPDEFVHATPFSNLHVLPSSPELDFLERKLEAKHKIYKLREALSKLSESYDRIYVDTAPALNFYTRSALIAAERVLIPFDCDDFSRQALYNILGEIQELQSDHNPDLKVEGIVANQFQPAASLPRRLVAEMTEEGLPVLPVTLNASVKMKESHQESRPLVYFAPKHPLTQQFRDLHSVIHGQKIRAKAAAAT